MRIVLADDHSIVRYGVRQIIESDLQGEVIGEACNGEHHMPTERKKPEVAEFDDSTVRLGIHGRTLFSW